MISMKLFALALFVLMYVLMITKPAHRPLYALGVAVIYLLTGVLPVRELFGTINWNVLMMISGTMIIVDFFIESRMPHLLADILLEKSKNVMWVTIYMSLFAGIISAFIDNVATVLMVLALICASFIPDTPSVINGVICCVLAVVTIALDLLKNRSGKGALRAVKNLDLETLLLLTGLFVVIGGITEAGIIDDFAGFIAKAGGKNLFLLYTIIVWGSVLISAFVDNIPYVATMLPVLTAVTRTLGVEPYLLYFGLLTGATLGGNLTPIGASANIAAVGLLRKEGHEVAFRDFMRIGVPFTLTAVLVGYLYIWFVWA